MRTAEIIRWDCAMIDKVNFLSCDIRRAKTDDVQTGVGVPEVLRPFLRVWWERGGSMRKKKKAIAPEVTENKN